MPEKERPQTRTSDLPGLVPESDSLPSRGEKVLDMIGNLEPREEPPIIAMINQLLRDIDTWPLDGGPSGFIFTPGNAQISFFHLDRDQPLDSRAPQAMLTRLKIMAGIDITAPAPQIGKILLDGQDVEENQYFLVQTWPTVLGEEMMVRRIPKDHPSFPINNLLGEAMVLNPPRIERPKNGGIEVFEREDDDTSLGAELLDVLSDPEADSLAREFLDIVPQEEQKPPPIGNLVWPIVWVIEGALVLLILAKTLKLF